MKRILVVGGGPINQAYLKSQLVTGAELIIAADKGGAYILKAGYRPNLLIGDFDSLDYSIVQELKKAGTEILSYPAAKDQTDLELAIDLAVKKNPDRIDIIGGLGGRLDHTLGNIGLLLRALENNIEAHLLSEDHDITVINKEMVLKREPGWAVSLIPLTMKVIDVTTSGLAFKLEKAVLYSHNTRGIHNEFAEETAKIELTQGILMVICFKY